MATFKEKLLLTTILIVAIASFTMLGLSVLLLYHQPNNPDSTTQLSTMVQDLTYGWKVGFSTIAITAVGNLKGLFQTLVN